MATWLTGELVATRMAWSAMRAAPEQPDVAGAGVVDGLVGRDRGRS